METLELHGKRYISAGKAARDNGYTSDYVGQLCRSGAVDATRVGRSWYVSADDIKSHRSDKKRATKKVSHSSLVKSVSVTHKKNSVGIDDGSYERRYSSVAGSVVMVHDTAPLIPELRKHTVRPLISNVQKDVVMPLPSLRLLKKTNPDTQEIGDVTTHENVVNRDQDVYSEQTVAVPITITHEENIEESVEEYIFEREGSKDDEILVHEPVLSVHTHQKPQNIPQSFSTRRMINYTQVLLVLVCILSVAFLSTVLLVEKGEVRVGRAVVTYTANTNLLYDVQAGFLTQ